MLFRCYMVCLHCDVTGEWALAPGGASVKSIQLIYTRTEYVFYYSLSYYIPVKQWYQRVAVWHFRDEKWTKWSSFK